MSSGVVSRAARLSLALALAPLSPARSLSATRSAPRRHRHPHPHHRRRRALDVRAMATGGNNVDDARRRSHARAARALPITLITVSRGGGPAMDRACEEWSAKIARYVAFDEKVVRPNPKNAKDPVAQMRAEGERVMKHVQPDDFVVALDERGKDLTSEGFAALLADAGDAGKRSVVFALGGPFGHDDAVRRRADVQLRLGAMVMNHQVARIVALEQMYRAWTILRGEPYHH
jgi:23S rRNA (pseudouridine1915-N3)-methyltransferase